MAPPTYRSSSASEYFTDGGSVTINASADFVILGTMENAGSDVITALTVNSVSATKEYNAQTGAFWWDTFSLVSPATGSQVVGVTGEDGAFNLLHCDFSGVNLSAPIRSDNSASGAISVTELSVTVPTTTVDDLIVGFFRLAGNAGTVTPKAGVTIRTNVASDRVFVIATKAGEAGST
jgi:hypothetical protein